MRRLQFFHNRADGRAALSSFPKPPEKPPLFLPHFIPSHPILEISHLLGGRRNPRTALPDGVNRARGLPKATYPLTCTQFDPALHPRFSFSFLHPALYQCSFLGAPLWPPASSINVVLGFIPPKSPQRGFGLSLRYRNATPARRMAHGASRRLTGGGCLVPHSLPSAEAAPNPATQRNLGLFSVNISLPVFTGTCLLSVCSFLIGTKIFPWKKPIGISAYGLLVTPRVGLEPTTTRLTAECSTIELSRIILDFHYPSV